MASEKLNNTDALPKLNFDDLDEPVVYGFGELSNKNKKRKLSDAVARSASFFLILRLLDVRSGCSFWLPGGCVNTGLYTTIGW